MKVKITLYPDKIKALQDAIDLSGEMAAEAIHTDINLSGTVPKDTSELERSAFVKKSKSKYAIVYDRPYARRLYWHPEYNFKQDKNPNAQGLWMQTYIDGSKKDLFRQYLSKFIKINGKGLVT